MKIYFLSKNHSILKIKFHYRQQLPWVSRIEERNKKAFFACQFAAAYTRKGLRDRVERDVSNLIADLVLDTEGDPVWNRENEVAKVWTIVKELFWSPWKK